MYKVPNHQIRQAVQRRSRRLNCLQSILNYGLNEYLHLGERKDVVSRQQPGTAKARQPRSGRIELRELSARLTKLQLKLSPRAAASIAHKFFSSAPTF